MVELLTVLSSRCVELLPVSAAGVMLASPDGELRVVASSTEAMRVVETFEQQAQEGPCPDCFRSGEAVHVADLAATDRWAAFTPVAVAAGFRSVNAVPMRLRGTVVGALNLFGRSAGALDAADANTARGMADIATIAILQHRVAWEAQAFKEQLHRALSGRVVLEQAKGIVSECTGLSVEQSFDRLRSYARANNRRLADVAREVVEGRLAAPVVEDHR